MYDRHLDTFIAVADAGSFTKAAQGLYITPNAVMKQINLLESDLGICLFERSNHGLRLTGAGELIYRDAKYLIRHTQRTLEEARALASRGENVVRVGSSLMRPGQAVVELWQKVSRACPDTKLEIRPFDDQRDSYLEVVSNLGRDIDIVCGIFPSTRFDGRCNALELGRQQLRCAVSMDNPLSRKKRLEVGDLRGEKLIMVQRGDTSYIDALRDDLEANHPDIEIVDVPYYDVRTMNLCESLGGIMITADLWRGIHPSLVTLPVEWDYAVPYGILYSLSPSEPVRRFVNAVDALRGETSGA